MRTEFVFKLSTQSILTLWIKLLKRLKLSFVLQDCSSDNISPSGYVSSPRYPWYPNDMNCRQYIEVPENFSIKLDIQEFYLEPLNDFLFVSICIYRT